jgi:hypothetical protein
MKDLRERWHATRMDWGDEQARRFEERFIMNLDADLRIAISAMDDMAALLSQIRQECD